MPRRLQLPCKCCHPQFCHGDSEVYLRRLQLTGKRCYSRLGDCHRNSCLQRLQLIGKRRHPQFCQHRMRRLQRLWRIARVSTLQGARNLSQLHPNGAHVSRSATHRTAAVLELSACVKKKRGAPKPFEETGVGEATLFTSGKSKFHRTSHGTPEYECSPPGCLLIRGMSLQ